MKRQITLILIFLCSICAVNAQSFRAEYTYDANGNRITATVIYLSLKSAILDTASVDSINIEQENKIDEAQNRQLPDNFNIRIYPNPVQNDLLVEINGASPDEFTEQGNAIKLINLSGQIVLDVKSVSSYNTIDLTKFVQGTYILALYINGKTKTYKILKK